MTTQSSFNPLRLPAITQPKIIFDAMISTKPLVVLAALAFVSVQSQADQLSNPDQASADAKKATTDQVNAVKAKNADQNNSSAASDDFDDPFFGSDTAASTDSQANTKISDPLEGYNRVMFSINSKVDKAVVKPTATTYKKITPEPVRSGISRFFSNLREPWNAINLLLQGQPSESAKSLGRFSINTITSLGFADPAGRDFGLSVTQEDFGQTLGVWGLPEGPYIVLPALGPSTLKDTAGRAVGTFGGPTYYIDDTAAQVALNGIELIDKRAGLLSMEGFVNTDDYELVRDVYLQKRRFDTQENGGRTNPDNRNKSANESGFDTDFGD